MSEAWIEDPVLRQRYRFTRSADPDRGEVLHVHMQVEPGGGVTPHVHPAMEERFTVLAGRLELLAGRTWSEAGPGETVVVSPGTRHAFRNRGDVRVEVRADARPPSSLQAFLTEVAALSRAGRFTARGLPRGFDAALQMAALVERHREMVVLGFPPMPPEPLQRLLLPPLSRLRGFGLRSSQARTSGRRH